MLRNLGAVLAGCVLGVIVILFVEMMGHAFYPPPKEVREALRSKDLEVQKKAIEKYLPNAPVGAMLFVPLAWGVGTLAGGYLAGRVANPGSQDVAWGVGGLMLLCAVIVLSAIPHPIWMQAGVLMFPLGAYGGSCLSSRAIARSVAED